MTDSEAIDKAVAAVRIAWDRVIGVTVETDRAPHADTRHLLQGAVPDRERPIVRERIILEMQIGD